MRASEDSVVCNVYIGSEIKTSNVQSKYYGYILYFQVQGL